MLLGFVAIKLYQGYSEIFSVVAMAKIKVMKHILFYSLMAL